MQKGNRFKDMMFRRRCAVRVISAYYRSQRGIGFNHRTFAEFASASRSEEADVATTDLSGSFKTHVR